MQVIGIGTGGSQIANELAQHKAYDVLLIDTSFADDLNNVKTVLIKKQETIKDYEEKTKLDIGKKVRHNDVHVFCSDRDWETLFKSSAKLVSISRTS